MEHTIILNNHRHLAASLLSACIAASKYDKNNILSAVNLQYKATEAKLLVTGTDGNILHSEALTVDTEDTTSDSFTLNLDNKALEAFAKELCKVKSVGVCKLSLICNTNHVNKPNMIIVSAETMIETVTKVILQLDGHYPQFEQLFPSQHKEQRRLALSVSCLEEIIKIAKARNKQVLLLEQPLDNVLAPIAVAYRIDDKKGLSLTNDKNVSLLMPRKHLNWDICKSFEEPAKAVQA